MAYVFARHFAREDCGDLVNISSVLGKKVRPTAGAYAGTKFAIEALSEALRMELSHRNVSVSCTQPGLVMTGLHDRWDTHPREALGIADPLRPDDIARMPLGCVQGSTVTRSARRRDEAGGSSQTVVVRV